MKEVYTTPRDVAGTTGQTAWQPRESDPGLEAEFLRRVMVRLGAQEEKAKQLAASRGAARKARAGAKERGLSNGMLEDPTALTPCWPGVGPGLARLSLTHQVRRPPKGLESLV